MANKERSEKIYKGNTLFLEEKFIRLLKTSTCQYFKFFNSLNLLLTWHFDTGLSRLVNGEK
jgi:hypothetical protein